MSTHTKKDDSRDIAPERIARLLNHAAQQLDDNTLVALRRARHIALERQLQSKPVFALSTGHGLNWMLPHTPNQLVATIILVAAIILGGASYLHHSHENDIARLDAAILTDDIPLEAFVD